MKWELAPLLLLLAGGAMAEMIEKGSTFPSWELVDHQGRKVSSQELAGKTYLLWFYPKAMTAGCTKEGCELRDHFAEFRELGVEILGVSFDPPEVNAQFAAEQRFPFRLLSDRNRRLAVLVGAADAPDAPSPRRISYLVGPDGKVIKAYPSVNPSTHAEEVLKDLQALGAR